MVQTIRSFDDFAAGARESIEAALAENAEFGADCPQSLGDAIRYSLLSGGKRLRALIVVAASEACGGLRQEALPAACAVEMIHAYSLIHDDLPAMDDDDLRRGRPTCHKQFGEAIAILAGDALQARALEILATQVRPAAVAARTVAELAAAAGAANLVGGQCDDLAAEHRLAAGEAPGDAASDLELLNAIHRRKTGALIRVSARLGGLVAGADDDQLDALARYGAAVGLAFQITDDLLDAEGDEQLMGKRVQKDAQRGKLTFPHLIGLEESRRRAQQLVDDACRAASCFGDDAKALQSIARFVNAREN